MDLNLFKPRRIEERIRTEKIREKEELLRINKEVEEFELNFPDIMEDFEELYNDILLIRN